MKVPQGEWDGAQPRQFVFDVLRKHGVQINPLDEDDWFELLDHEGDAVSLRVGNPVLRSGGVFLASIRPTARVPNHGARKTTTPALRNCSAAASAARIFPKIFPRAQKKGLRSLASP
jgi:hypothetical protein